MAIVDQFGRPIPSLKQQRLAANKQARRAELQAAYDAAQTTGENKKHWQWADDMSAAAANSIHVRRTLRMRARYECLQANSFGWGIVQTLANDTVSTGPTLQINFADSVSSRRIERLWQSWVKRSGLVQKLRTARLAKCVDGEAFLIRCTNPAIGGQVKLDVKLIEADQIATPGYMEGKPGSVDGIHFDRYGNPAVYHVLKQHPGDTWVFDSFDKDDYLPQDMIHLFSRMRPGQARGIPEITTALPLFAMLRRYTLATILAAEIAADFAAVLETEANPYDSTGENASEPVTPFDSVQIDRGMMTSLPAGWKMNQFDPKQPTTSYEGFRNAILQEIARCVHMPSNKARGDSSSYNYSSARLDHQIYYHAIEIERNNWEIECLDRIFDWWLAEAMLVPGYLPPMELVDDVPHEWTWPPIKSSNPQEDASVAVELLNAGLITDKDYLASQNKDLDVHYQQLREQMQRRKALGLLTQEQLMAMQAVEAAAKPQPTEAATPNG